MTAPSETDLCAALGAVCTRGLAPYWVASRAPVLLELACVRCRVPEHADDGCEDVLIGALTGLLRELVGKLTKPNRILLTIVLALDVEYLGRSAGARRRAAGERFRDGLDQVSGGTIRTHHEPEAIRQLAALLYAEEQRVAVPALFEQA